MSGHTVTLGSGGQAPAWVADPTRALGPFGSGGSLLLKNATNATLPWNVGGGANDLRAFSLFWYFKLMSAAPGGEYWIWRLTGSSGGVFRAMLADSGRLKTYRFWGAGDIVAEASTAVAVGQECTMCVTSGRTTSDKVKVFVNGVKEAETAITNAIPGFSAQPTMFWGSDNAGFTGGAGVPALLGRTLVYDGELSETQVAGIHLTYRTMYPGLPAL